MLFRSIVATTPGSTQDVLARIVGGKLSDALKQAMVIDNRPGAAGILGASVVAKSTPDGYTLSLAGPGLAVLAGTRDNLPFDVVKDFRGIAQIGYNTTALLVNPGLGVKSVKELIALAHVRGGKLLYGTSAAGSSTHMTAERFRMAAGIKATHVGFKGQPEFLLEIAAGRVHYGVSGLTAALSLIKSGQLLPLAVTSQKRATTLPDVPTAAEVIPAWSRDGSHGLMAPNGTPVTIIQQLNREMNRIIASADVQQRLGGYDFNFLTSTPEEYDKALRADIETFRRIAIEAGLRAK